MPMRLPFGPVALAAMILSLAGVGSLRADSSGALTNEMLNRIVPDTEMNEVPLRDAINYVQQDTGANIFVNWNALTAAGVSNLTPITLSLQDVTVGKLLSLIMTQASPSVPTVQFIDNNVLMITTREDADTQMVTRVYDVSDLVMSVPDFTGAPSFNLSSASQNQSVTASSSGGGGGGASSGNLFSGGGSNSASSTTSATDQLTQITQLIENSVDRNSWVDNGGTVGTVRSLNGQLIINQTPSAMTKISNLL